MEATNGLARTSREVGNSVTGESELPLVMSVEDVARALGMDVQVIQRAVRRGELPARRVGRKVRFHRDAIMRWLAAGE